MAVSIGTLPNQRITSVANAVPGTIGGVTTARPGTISGVTVAQPSTISSGLPKIQQNVTQGNAVVNDARRQNAQLQAQISSLLASLRPTAPAPIDVAAINAQARKQAEEAVNPLYTKRLNDLLAREALKRQRAQEDYTGAVQDAEASLKQAQDASALVRNRTTEDIAQNTGKINTLEDQFQTAAGQQFEDQRLAEAGQLAASGLTTSGIGRQQAARTIDQRNISEKQQTEDFQLQRVAQATLKARTFEDLAQSDLLAGQKAEKGKKAVKVELDRLLEDVNQEEQANKFDLEQQRLSDVASQTGSYGQAQFNNYLASIRDPRVLEATAKAYGGLFS